MNTDKETTQPTQPVPLRLWPGIILVILQWLVRFVLPALMPDAIPVGMFGGVICGLAVVIWWAFFSRAPRFDRWTAIVLMAAALVATSQLIHKSLATAMMGMMFTIFSIPVICLAFVVWAVASRHLSTRLRRVTMVITILIASFSWAFLRSDGMDGEGHQFFAWRWAITAEERLLEQTDNKLITISSDTAFLAKDAEWPGFRGRNRDGIIHGSGIGTDWTKTPPVEMWRRAVGPGCSSFAVHGPLLFTQEQRGEYEMVTCYDLKTGEPVWRHGDKARFWDSHAGAGPRSTPTLYNKRVYTQGATGILNVLDELNGHVVWSRDAAKDAGMKIPGWGYTGSPLVVDSLVVVAIAGKLVAYDIVKGQPLWFGPDGGISYSSPQLLTIAGEKQILMMSNIGATSFTPSSGKVLWKFPGEGYPIVQSALVDESDLLISTGEYEAIQRIALKKGSGGWTCEERWKSNKLRPDFNDFVIHNGHVYGFEGPSLTCLGIAKGDRKWRGGRYGGQLILLADQDLLLVLSEVKRGTILSWLVTYC
ncbi:MAG: PQQ-binding-like beta-propeller repeat protein [Bacteroidetes bacterium]|nr:PQQ-binding-like beta-propeller repeat protein [Bacteroidota bacterium]